MEDKNSKEVNLLQLLSLMVNWLKKVLKNLFHFIGFLLQLAFKYWPVSLAIMVLSVLAGQYLARPSARKYQAGAIAMLYGNDISTAKEISRQLQNTISTNESLSLSSKLGIADSVGKNIVKIEVFNVIDYLDDYSADLIDFKKSHSLSDTTNLVMQDRVYIRVTTRNISQINTFQDALLKYFNENPKMKRRFESTKSDLQAKIDACDKEINRLDSLAKVSYFKEQSKNISLTDNKLIVGEQKKQLFYEDILMLQDIKASINGSFVDFKQPMEFPAGLVIDSKPINGRVKYGIYSLMIGLALVFLATYLLENFKKIFNFLTSKKQVS